MLGGTGPTPSGVPVMITSPSSSVMMRLTWAMRNGILCTMSDVLPSWRSSSSTWFPTVNRHKSANVEGETRESLNGSKETKCEDKP